MNGNNDTKLGVFTPEYRTALDFCANLMRYHGDTVSVEMLSSSQAIRKDVEMVEKLTLYTNMDDLAHALDVHTVNFNDYREVTSNGFKEII